MAKYKLVKIGEHSTRSDKRVVEIFRHKERSACLKIGLKSSEYVNPPVDSMQLFAGNPLGITAMLFYDSGDVAYCEMKDGSVYKAVRVSGKIREGFQLVITDWHAPIPALKEVRPQYRY